MKRELAPSPMRLSWCVDYDMRDGTAGDEGVPRDDDGGMSSCARKDSLSEPWNRWAESSTVWNTVHVSQGPARRGEGSKNMTIMRPLGCVEASGRSRN